VVVSWLIAAIHLLALGIGFGAVRERASALRGTLDETGFRRVFRSDAWWAVAAVLWLVTGLLRAFGGLEKGTAYYLGNGLFHAKLTLFILIVGLEIAPMIDLMKWRTLRGRGTAPDTSRARRWAVISDVQATLLIVLVFLGTAIARGFGAK
jgi:putative membrane protein